MIINIQGHGINLTPPLKEYAGKKIAKLDEFFNNIIKAEVILDARSIKAAIRSHVAEVSLWVGGKKVIRASEAGQDMYAAIDLVSEELKSQLKKHKEKHIQEKRRQGKKFKKLSREYNVDEEEEQEGPKIVKRPNFEIKTMTREEAKAELKLLGLEFIVFRNAEDGEATVLYGRKFVDGSTASELSADDAAAKFKKGKRKLLPFFNSETNQLNILYKINSGDFGLIEPSF
ncbi:MAG: ribosome-associated translation inhibitor RaiA [Candidatus Saganbacteria bacterium]|nr:ribosome-associated translation inhibitor RaiA [Candidatus Saganbacteria bacterium]